MTEQDNPHTRSEEEIRESISARKAFYLGRLYVCALARGWDDIASCLLDILHAHGFDVRKFDGKWELEEGGEEKK